MIQGINIHPLKQLKDDRGKIMHMMRNDSDFFKNFGEIYFSTVNQNYIKAWHLHKENTLNYVCIHGKVKLVLFDDRKESKTFNQHQEIILSPDNYFLVTIPPGIWNGFKGLSAPDAIIANLIDNPHNDNEMTRLPHDDTKFNYSWTKS